jgi:hypothetical protein
VGSIAVIRTDRLRASEARHDGVISA